MKDSKVFSSLRPSRRARKDDNGLRQKLSLEVCASKHDLLALSMPAPPHDTPLSGYYYPWSPSSYDLLLQKDDGQELLSMSFEEEQERQQSPTLSVDLPSSSFGSLFRVPKRKPVPSGRNYSPVAQEARVSFDISLTTSCTGDSISISPSSVEWAPVFESSSETSVSPCSKSDSFDLPIEVFELPATSAEQAEAALEEEPKQLPQSLNKPCFRSFRNRLMLYSPVAPNPSMWNEARGQSVVPPC